MLTMVEVRTTAGALLSLPLGNALNGYIVEDIEGLNPVKATIVSSSFANIDGSQFQHSRRETRNILMKLGFKPNYVTTTIHKLRHRLYEFFMPESQINLRFYTSVGLVAEVNGWVEFCETPLFSKEPQVNISVLCFSPDLVDLNSVQLSGSSTSGISETLVQYSGTVDAGFIFTLNVNRSLNEFTIYHRPLDDSVRSLQFATPLVAGDIVTISTLVGNKTATLNRGGTVSSVQYAIAPQAYWIQFKNGSNYIRVHADGAGIPYNLSYKNRYGGL